ncbi:nuclear transport factor 2 family protein [Herbiconiux moechotypicola]|uniref:SnoaL-like domain-containing protein n=1 Tax=Herbiconiux moechotypicola TaxID=637393 RepID=A0ABN3D8D6_9MICO|nr:nuclear transport factor 2 family protein [Herbiconiux moechotypicola]MCS5728277.1 nuclear transport factor 2 family protein [Herbiconiux moechotypicola]
MNLPPAIRDFVEATNDGDRDRFLAAFTADAVLDDWGRGYTGYDGIAAWNDSDNMGVDSRIEVTSVEEKNGVVLVGVQVTGHGYNGGGTMAFTLADGLISRLDITG